MARRNIHHKAKLEREEMQKGQSSHKKWNHWKGGDNPVCSSGRNNQQVVSAFYFFNLHPSCCVKRIIQTNMEAD